MSTDPIGAATAARRGDIRRHEAGTAAIRKDLDDLLRWIDQGDCTFAAWIDDNRRVRLEGHERSITVSVIVWYLAVAYLEENGPVYGSVLRLSTLGRERLSPGKAPAEGCIDG